MHDDDKPAAPAVVTGTVVRAPFGKGSKSERSGIWLQAGQLRLQLRFRTGPSFGDRKLARYVGKTVRCDGILVDQLLLIEHITILNEN